MAASRALLLLALIAFAAGVVNAATRDSKHQPPNIIFILADDLGWGDLGSYGQKLIRTPRLDRMAAEGIRFTQAYGGSTVCAPSRCSLMTGLHQGHARIRGNQPKVDLRPEDVTVAEVLKAAGYRTGVIGKWGLGQPGGTGVPNRQGFDYWFGYLDQWHAHDYYTRELWRNGNLEPVPEGTYSHDLFTREALEFVERERAGPFFLYLAYTIPHANNEAGENGMQVPSDAPYSEQPWPQPQRNEAAMITRMDRDVGRLLDLLAKLGLEERTVVFFSSDNGPHNVSGARPEFFQSAGGLRGIKRDLYEGGIRVPMIARGPSRIRAGQVSDQPWAFWDFLPTVAALAGGRAPAGIDGRSMAEALEGRRISHAPFYWEFHEGGFKQALRVGRWKAVRNKAGAPLEIYDLQSDPAETRDLATAQANLARRFLKMLGRLRDASPDWPTRPGTGTSHKPQS
jgi:arylsulfatase A